MDEKQLQFLYNEYAKGKGFKDYSEFKGLMSSEGSRKLFFDDANKELGFKDYNEFSDLLGLKKKVGGEISSPTELPSVSREYLDKGQELADGSFLKKIGEPDRSQLVSQYKSPDISLTQKPKKDYYSTKLEKGLIFDKEGQLYAPSSEALSKDITAAEQASLKKSTQKDLVEKSREMPVAEPAKEPTEEQGLLLNLVSALDRGFAKNFISNPMKGLGTFLQGTTKKVLGGSGEGDLSNALIRYGDYLNNAIDELTPQDEEFKNSLWDQAAQALGQVGSLVLTGGLTGAAGKGAALVAQAPKGAVATAASRIASQLSAPTSISAGLSMGQAEFDRAKQAGATDDQAFEAFYKNAVTGSVLETIPVMQFFKRFNKATAGGFVNYLKTKGVAGFTGGVEELTTEILQQLYANKTAKDIYNINQSILDGVGTSGGIGFGVGFLLNAMGANARILRKQEKTQDAIAIENQIEQYEDNLKNPKVTSGNTAKDIVTQGVEIGTQKAVQDLDRDLANNVITPEKYQEEIAFAEKAAQVADKIPETVTGESKVKSVELLVERNDIKQANQNLLQQKQSTDEAYHAGIDEEIKANEEKIKEIDAKVYDIAKKPSKDFGDKKYIVDGEEVSKEAFEALQGKPLGTKTIVEPTEIGGLKVIKRVEDAGGEAVYEVEGERFLTADGKELAVAKVEIPKEEVKPSINKTESFFNDADILFPNDDIRGGYAVTNESGKQIGRVKMSEVNENTVKIDEVVSEKKGERTGNGSAIMKMVVDNADKNNVKLVLTPNLIGEMKAKGFETADKLRSFYEKFGFVKDKGKATMTRESKIVEIKEAVKPTEVKAEAKPTESEKSDVEKTLYPTLSGSIPLSEALPNGVYKKISNDLFAYADKGDKIAAIVDRANGNIVSKSFWNAKDGKWQLPNKANLKDDAKRFGINEDVYIKKYQDAVDILNSEVKPTQAKAAEVKPTEVKIEDVTSKQKDEKFDAPTLKSPASNYEKLYVPKKVVEEAYKNDKDNNPVLGGGGQSLETIIRRGGYSIEELNNLLPNWKDIASVKEVKPTEVKVEPIDIRKELRSQIDKKEIELIEKQQFDIDKAKKDLKEIENDNQEVISEYVKKSGYKLITKDTINPASKKGEKFPESDIGKYYKFTGSSLIRNSAKNLALKGAEAKAKSTPQGSKAGMNKYSNALNSIKNYENGDITKNQLLKIIKDSGLDIEKFEIKKQEIPTEVKEEITIEEEPTQSDIAKQQTIETDLLIGGQAAQRRKDNKYTKDGVEYIRNSKGNGVPSSVTGDVRFTNEVSLPFKYKLIEAKDLQPSHQDGMRNPNHFIPEAQPKNRNDAGSLMAENSFSSKPRFEELGENTNAYSGAPIVNERGEVVQGNNRAAGLRKGYDAKNQQYKNDLANNSSQFGFTKEQVEKMNEPILVREVAVSDEGAIEVGNYDVKDLETGGKRRLDPIAITRRMPFDIKGRIAEMLFTGEETLNQAIRANQKRVLELLNPYLNQAQRNTITKEGVLTDAGIKDLEDVVKQFLFDNGDTALPDLFENLSANQKEGLKKSLPYIFSTSPDKSIVPDIQEAILAVADFRDSGAGDFNAWLAQGDMFADGKTPRDKYTPLEIEIAKTLIEAKTQKEIVKKFGDYSDIVKDKEANMFDPAIAGKTRAEGIKEIFKTEDYAKPISERGGKTPVRKEELAAEPSPKPRNAKKEKIAREEAPEKGVEEAYKDLTINQKRQIINSKFDELLKELKIEKICPT